MKFTKELEKILSDDPLGLLKTKPKVSGVITADARLQASFEEINDFIRENDGHEPEQSRNIQERRLFSRLKGLRENPEKAVLLLDFDEFDLLEGISVPEPGEINNIEDVLNDDSLGLLDEDDLDEIFELKHVPKSIDMPEEIARRKPCKDFDLYENLFKQCHADLVSGKKELRKFSGEQQISQGHFFILHGVMVYIAKVAERTMQKGKNNARMHCIFENGTESRMLLRSLARELYKDEGGKRVLLRGDQLFKELDQVKEDDLVTGYIYILESKSDNPEISSIENLYKIGFSRQAVIDRIKNAKQQPTYLMADVRLITEYITYNLNPQKLEFLLHRFFSQSCLNIDVIDEHGQRHKPQEWFIVPLNVIETAVQLLINGEIVNYRYDHHLQQIASK